MLRFEDGHRTKAQLEVISLTGGMLNLPKPVERESQVKLMFLTPTGPGARHRGNAEAGFLEPATLPFRGTRARRPAPAAGFDSNFIWSGCNKKEDEQQEWIEKYRAALDCRPAPRKQLFSSPLAAFALAMLSLGSAIYLFGIFDVLFLHLK